MKMYDEEGQPTLDKSGRQKYRTVTMLPDGRLGLRLLALRNPADWGGKGEQPLRPAHADELPAQTIVSSFEAAFEVLFDSGALPRPTLALHQEDLLDLRTSNRLRESENQSAAKPQRNGARSTYPVRLPELAEDPPF